MLGSQRRPRQPLAAIAEAIGLAGAIAATAGHVGGFGQGSLFVTSVGNAQMGYLRGGGEPKRKATATAKPKAATAKPKVEQGIDSNYFMSRGWTAPGRQKLCNALQRSAMR